MERFRECLGTSFGLRRSVCHYTWSTNTRRSTLVLSQLSLRAEWGMDMSKRAKNVAFNRLAILGRAGGRQDETFSQGETQVLMTEHGKYGKIFG